MMGSSKGIGEDMDYKHLEFQCLVPSCFRLLSLLLSILKEIRDAVAYTKTCVSQWDSIRLVLPDNLFDQTLQGGTNHSKTLILNKKKKIRISAGIKNTIFHNIESTLS